MARRRIEEVRDAGGMALTVRLLFAMLLRLELYPGLPFGRI